MGILRLFNTQTSDTGRVFVSSLDLNSLGNMNQRNCLTELRLQCLQCQIYALALKRTTRNLCFTLDHSVYNRNSTTHYLRSLSFLLHQYFLFQVVKLITSFLLSVVFTLSNLWLLLVSPCNRGFGLSAIFKPLL